MVPASMNHTDAGAWPAAKQVVRLPGEYVSPAAALWVGAHMWAWLSPNSYHVLQCLAASVPVMAGYAQTKRAAATGQLAAGGTLPTAVLLYTDCANHCLLHGPPVMAGYAQTKRAAATGQLAAGGTLLTAVLLYTDCANRCVLHGPPVMADCAQTKRAAAT